MVEDTTAPSDDANLSHSETAAQLFIGPRTGETIDGLPAPYSLP